MTFVTKAALVFLHFGEKHCRTPSLMRGTGECKCGQPVLQVVKMSPKCRNGRRHRRSVPVHSVSKGQVVGSNELVDLEVSWSQA